MAGTFVGRELDLRSIGERLAKTRLVTLLGLGGIGKTRLAREFGRRQTAEVVFCELSTARSAEDVCSAVASAIGVGLAVGLAAEARIDAVGRALATRSLLLILDEAEAAAGDLGRVADRWIERAPNVNILVTSRVRIGTSTEHVLPIEPLHVDDATGPSDAERLFVERATAAGARIGDGDREDVAALVRVLEGIPLAIELTAARARLLPVSDLLGRVRRGQEVGSALTGEERRHATMRDVIDGSWQLLGADTREALLACACFRGGFSMASAEALLGERALELLQALVDASLVRPLSSTADSGARFDLFETVRAYATERMTAEPELGRALLRRHALHIAEAAASWRELASKTGGAKYLATLAREHDNLVVALMRLLETKPLDLDGSRLALTLAIELEPIRLLRGHARTYADWVKAALATLPPGDLENSLRGLRLKATLCEAGALSELGLAREGADAFARAIALSLEEGDAAAEGRARCGLARLDAHRGAWKQALEGIAQAKVCAVRSGDEDLLQIALASTSFYGSELSDSEDQLIPIEQAAKHFHRRGNERESLLWAIQLGRAYTDFDRTDRARTCLVDALARARAIGDRRSEGFALFGLGGLHLSTGELDDAAVAYADATGILAEVGKERDRGYALGYLGVVEHLRRRFDAAEEAYAAGCSALVDAGDAPNATLFSLFLAGLEADRDRIDDAKRLLARVRESATEWSGGGMRPLVTELVTAMLDAARARVAERKTDLDALTKHRCDAEERMKLAFAQPEHIVSSRDAYDWRDVSLDARIAFRLAERALESVKLPASCMVVVRASLRFRTTSEGEWVDLSTRRVLRQILERLVDQRLTAPGRSVSASSLIEAGWPGERLTAASSANRLHVALGTLRRLGLEEVIERSGNGWRLRNDIPLLRVDA